jgi:hypothetical protein
LFLRVRCSWWQIVHRSLTLGEVLDGDRMAESLYNVKFKGVSLVLPRFLHLSHNPEPIESASLCKMTLSAKDIRKYMDVVEDLYYFELVVGASNNRHSSCCGLVHPNVSFPLPVCFFGLNNFAAMRGAVGLGSDGMVVC